jgi:beta-aspartyl-dipeptidase (metallo-type)
LFKLIKQAHVYSPVDCGIRDIFICNDKIIEVGQDLRYDLPGLLTIDAGGMTAIPGYIDQHVHVTGGGGEGSFKTRVPELVLSDCIRAGVTTVMGLLGTDGITRSVENLLAKTKALNEEGITAYCLTGSYEYPTQTLTGDVKKDIAFLQEVLGVKIAISDHRSSHVTMEELTRLASDVRVASLIGGKPGLLVFHLGRAKTGLDLLFRIVRETEIPIKHLRPTHVQKVLDDAIEFGKMGGYIDFTADEKGAAATDIAKALASGVSEKRITVSTDSNGSMPRWNDQNEMIGIMAAVMTTLHQTVMNLVTKESIPLPVALGFATENVANGLEIGARKGRVASGLDADIVLLDGQMGIRTVIARGEIMMRDGHLLKKGTFEA